MTETADIAQATVHRHDPDRFVISLLMKPAVRPALWALYAFNYEIARTREVVTDPPLGLIRLEWWREALAESLRPAPFYRHEVLKPLSRAIQRYDLPLAEFHNLINAREADMDPAAIRGPDALREYAIATNAPLLRLGARICGEDCPEPRLGATAAAYGLTGLLRAHAVHAASGGLVTDTAAVRSRAVESLRLAGKRDRTLAGRHAALAALYLKRLDRHGPAAPPFLLTRLLLGL